MRFLICHPGPQFSVADVHNGWCEALRELGQQVVEFNTAERLTFYDSAMLEVGRRDDGAVGLRKAVDHEQAIELALNGLYATLYKTRPDVLLSISGFFLHPEMLDHIRRQGTRVVIVHTESPYEDDRQLKLAPHADLNLLNDPQNIQRFADVAPALYVPHAYRPAIHHPGPAVPDLVCDLGFVGTGFPSRIQFLEQMNLDGIDVLLAGNWQQLDESSPLRKYVGHDIEECLDNTQTADVYRSARVGINMYRREAEAAHLTAGLAMGPREVEMAACGAFFLRDPRPEGDQVLGMLPAFTGPDDAAEQLRWHLDHPEVRTRLAGQAREAIADRTFANHAAALLRLLDR